MTEGGTINVWTICWDSTNTWLTFAPKWLFCELSCIRLPSISIYYYLGGGEGQGKASVLNKVQLMQLSCHLDSLNYDRLLSWHLKCDLMIRNGLVVCTHESLFPGDFILGSRHWEHEGRSYQLTDTQGHCELWLLESRRFETVISYFMLGFAIVFFFARAMQQMITFNVYFSPLPMHSIIYSKKCVEFYLFWKMRNNNRFGGWAGHTRPHQPHLSAGYWYSRYPVSGPGQASHRNGYFFVIVIHYTY